MHFEQRHFLQSGPLISVIVPVYNTEAYVDRCVQSIVEQTYQHLQIILVNDASTDGSKAKLDRWAQADPRVLVLTHAKNEGLFQARLTGVAHAKGEYVAFVDSDDYISCDWLRLLIECALMHDCDMVAGNFCFDYGEEDRQILTLDPFQIKEWALEGDDVFYTFMQQAGSCFSWHTVWSKLYRKALWDQNMPAWQAYVKAHGHMIMWEDVAFSCALWMSARRFRSVQGALYFYVKNNNEASTAASYQSADMSRGKKYIRDVAGAMTFFRQQLEARYKDSPLYPALQKSWAAWNDLAYRQLFHDLVRRGSRRYLPILKEYFGGSSSPSEPDDAFYRLRTPVSAQFAWWNDVVKAIVSPDTQVVSFDVFDTLVKRSVWQPTDVFELLSNELNERFHLPCIDFAALRQNAEARARAIRHAHHPAWQEIRLTDIYAFLEENSLFSKECLQWAMNREIELELELCCARRTGRILFDIAMQAGKRIIICSDMYLPADVIERILQKSGFSGYERIFVSSEYGVTKASEALYRTVTEALRTVRSDAIVHIGDNYESDLLRARKAGWRAFHVCKSSDLLLNDNPGIYTGEAIRTVLWRNRQCMDMKVFQYFLSLRCILGLMASHCFDVPFVHTHPDSDYNADPRRIGYMALGPHLLGLCHWIDRMAAQRQIPTIHFVARDGFLVKQAFEILSESRDVRTNYIRLSRKALVLAGIHKREDLYSLSSKINIWSCSAQKLSSYLRPIISMRDEQVFAILKRHKIPLTLPFNGIERFEEVIRIFANEIIDEDLLQPYQAQLRAYFSAIVKPGDYLFDVGYSGRPEAALSDLLGYPVGSLYLHTNNEIAFKRQKAAGCECLCFYHHKPAITGLLREHLLMEMGPSTVGYSMENGVVEPILEAYQAKYAPELITQVAQESALQFVRDFKQAFGPHMRFMDIRGDDASAWFEDYLHFSKPFDGDAFRCVAFEDDLGLGHNIISLVDLWRDEMAVGCPQHTGTNSHNGSALDGLYMDGYFVKAYKAVNRLFPKGSKARDFLKKAAGFVLRS